MALAESERELLRNWADAISELTADDRITKIFQRGLSDFHSLSNLEKTRFSVAVAQLVNVYISAVRMNSKSLINSQQVQIFGDICFALIITRGGREWWELTGPFFTIYDLMNERTKREGDTQPSWTELLPYFQPDPE